MNVFGLGRPNIKMLKASDDIGGLAQMLEHKNECVREEALDALISLSIEPPGLDVARRRNLLAGAALFVLQRFAKEQSVRRLKEILRDMDEVGGGYKAEAVGEALVELGASDVVLDFFDTHCAPDENGGYNNSVFGFLALLLVHAMSKRDVPLLKKLLQSDLVGSANNDSPWHKFGFCFPQLTVKFGGMRIDHATDIIAEIGGEDELIALERQASSWEVRWWAYRTLGNIGTARCLPTLIQALERNQPRSVPHDSAEAALTDVISRLSNDDLVGLTRHPQALIKNPALLELCKRSDSSTFEVFLSAASSETEEVSVAAIEVLGRMRRREAVAPLVELLKGAPSETVWCTAVKVLGEIGDEIGLAFLLSLSPEKIVEDVVWNAIAEGGGGSRLLEILKLQLDQLPPEKSLKLLMALSKYVPSSDLAETQDELAHAYVGNLGNPAWAERRKAIRALGQIGGNLATHKRGRWFQNDLRVKKSVQYGSV